MGFFSNRFPYTDFNKVNLDWIMRELKKLAPAADLVEQSAEALEQAQATAAAAQATATAAAAAVETVTTQAAEAVETAEEAKEIAQQAASATIADGSVTMAKLAQAVQDAITDAGEDAATALSAAGVAQQIGNQAQQTATNAGADAALALVNAENARQVGVAARTAAAAAQRTADQALAAAGTGAVWTYLTTLDSSDGTAKRATLPLSTKEVMLLIWDTLGPTYRASIYMPAAAFPTGNQSGYWCNAWYSPNGSLLSKQLYVYYNNGVVIQTEDVTTGCAIYYR